MKKKLSCRGGFSLSEMLMVVAILALVSAAGAAGASGVLASRNNMIQAADAEILGSTAAQVIADELRFGQNISISGSGDSVHLDSTSFGEGVDLKLDEGKLTAGGSQILGAKAYSGLQLDGLTFKVDSGNVEVSLSVNRDGASLWSETFTVVPLNGIGG